MAIVSCFVYLIIHYTMEEGVVYRDDGLNILPGGLNWMVRFQWQGPLEVFFQKVVMSQQCARVSGMPKGGRGSTLC